MTMSKLHIVERALELAGRGACRTVGEIRTVLRKEGYENVDQHFDGRAFKAQLTTLIKSSNGSAAKSSSG